MNLNVYAVTRRDSRVDAGKVVVASYVTKPVAQAVAREQRELGYEGVKVECWA